ncbi:7452_t:CDS:1, partial [Rhizophagus irregularis]
MKRLMTGISQDDQTSYRRLKENIEVILFLKIKKDLSEMLRIYEVDN